MITGSPMRIQGGNRSSSSKIGWRRLTLLRMTAFELGRILADRTMYVDRHEKATIEYINSAFCQASFAISKLSD